MTTITGGSTSGSHVECHATANVTKSSIVESPEVLDDHNKACPSASLSKPKHTDTGIFNSIPSHPNLPCSKDSQLPTKDSNQSDSNLKDTAMVTSTSQMPTSPSSKLSNGGELVEGVGDGPSPTRPPYSSIGNWTGTVSGSVFQSTNRFDLHCTILFALNILF